VADDDRLRFWLALRRIPRVGDGAFRDVVARLGGVASVFGARERDLVEAGCRSEAARAIASFRAWHDVDRERESARLAGVRLLCWDDDEYPTALRFIFDPPPVLWVRGRFDVGDRLAVAIVGSRKASAYGLASARRIASELAREEVTVVSGLARGIDAAAHRAAIDSGGRTIAVLGNGIDKPYPERHARLADEVAAHGVLVSEFPLGTYPAARNFPRRNRIVSGLALAAVVVEAGERSGSLITARLAAEQGREVLAVPGEADLPRTAGTHRLLRQGAAICERGADVIEAAFPWVLELRRKSPITPRSPTALGGDAKRMLDSFDATVVTLDRLIERSGLAAPRALEVLLALELEGRVVRHAGSAYSRSSERDVDRRSSQPKSGAPRSQERGADRSA
jgi:DNA processing protein